MRRPPAPRLHPAPDRPAPSLPAPAPDQTSPRGPGRRALLLAGSVAAVITVPVATAGLLTRGGDTMSAASSSGGGSSTGTGPSSPFPDVADDAPGLEAMLWAEETGVQPALEDGGYGPDLTITRGDLALVLHRFAGSPGAAAEQTPALLTDLGPDPTTAGALLWLHGRGALWGDHELRVHPEREATRAFGSQIVAALLRPALAGAGATWEEDSEQSGTQAPALSGLPDRADGDLVATAVHWLAAAGMLLPEQLTSDGREWDGEQALTREHLAIALHRIDEVITAVLP